MQRAVCPYREALQASPEMGRMAGSGTPPARAWCMAHGPGVATAGQTGRGARVATGLHRRCQKKGHVSDEQCSFLPVCEFLCWYTSLPVFLIYR